MPVLATLPMRAPRPAPMAIPRTGTKKSRPNSSPQNMPQLAPEPTRWWLVCTWYLPSLSRTITAIASGSMMRSWASLRASSAAASAVASSGYPMAIRSDIAFSLFSAGTRSGPVHQAGRPRAPPQAGDAGLPGARLCGWPGRLGVPALLVDLRWRAPAATRREERDRDDQADHPGDHQDHADDLQIYVRGLPGNAKTQNCADDDERDAAADCHGPAAFHCRVRRSGPRQA